MTMPAGVYYVGDLCYIMSDEWEEVIEMCVNAQGAVADEFQLADGRRFAMYNTAYGDGVYADQSEREYYVDSGTIGCILASDIDRPLRDIQLVQKIEFTSDFETESYGGIIQFGDVQIDTSPDDEDDRYADDREDYDYDSDEYED
jgi:hypothetical protein